MKSTSAFLIYLGLLCAHFIPAAYGADSDTPQKIQVTATIAPLAYFAERVGGEDVTTEVMVPSGVCLESYEPKLSQLKTSSRADIYLKVGHAGYSFETPWVEAILSNAPRVRVIDLQKELAQYSTSASSEAAADPHIWLQTSAARALAKSISRVLTEINPTRDAYYRQNLEKLETEIDDLDKELRAVFSGDEGKSFLVYHPAWGHFARSFGLIQLAVEQEGHEPSAGSLHKVINQAREKQIKLLIIQPGSLEDSATVVAHAIPARLESLDPLQHDWFASMRLGAKTIKSGLGQ